MNISNLFLRDASVQSENNFLKRLCRCIDLAKRNRLNIQITLDYEFFTEIYKELEQKVISEIQKVDKALIHLHSNYYLGKFGRNYFTEKSLAVINNLIQQCNNFEGFCVHPDLVDDFSILDKFIINNKSIGIEVLDKSVTFGNRFSEIKKMLAEYDFLDLVLDTAHIQEMEKEGEPDLNYYIANFGDRIKEIHVSQSGNYYDPDQMNKDFNTSHSLLSIADNDIFETLSKSNILKGINYVIEGVVPYEKYGEDLLEKEALMFKDNL